jgi:hypothetical protein
MTLQAIIPDTMQGALILSVIDFFASFVIISGIGAVLALFPLFNRVAKPVPAAAGKPKPAPAVAAPVAGPPADHIVVIAAAVQASLAGNQRIVRIEPSHGGAEWAAEGRLAHHGSHVLHGVRQPPPGGR